MFPTLRLITKPRLFPALAALIMSQSLVVSCGSTEETTIPAEPESGEHALVFDSLQPFECGEIQRMHTFDGIFLSGQPTPDDFEQAKLLGIKTVVNQRRPEEVTEFDESEVVSNLGLAYFNPAFKGSSQLTDAVLDQTRALLRDAERPLLIHCASANRTGAVWLAYRVLDDGASVEDALTEAKSVGLRSTEYEQIVRDYIDRQSTR